MRDLLGLASTFDGGVAILPKLYCHIDRYSRCLLLRGVRVRVRVRVRVSWMGWRLIAGRAPGPAASYPGLGWVGWRWGE